MGKITSFQGGVYPPENKNTAEKAIREPSLAERYLVPLHQHIGAPSDVLVNKKDEVLKGQCIADSGGFVSARIHAPTSGTVKAVTECITPTGGTSQAAEIEPDGEDRVSEEMAPIEDWENADADTLRDRIHDAGIVGMGGAAFPSHVKLKPPQWKKMDVLILNGAECEPYLTNDHRVMMEWPEKFVQGVRILAQVLGVEKIIVGIENNKPDAVETLRAALQEENAEVVGLDVHYPQGAEKQLIYTLTERKVPSGGLPLDVGCVVHNVGTAVAVAEAVNEGKPLLERVTTVTGTPVVNPGNLLVRVGTPLESVLKEVEGVSEDPAKIVFGGPMTGFSVCSLDVPVQKNTSGIVLLAPEEIRQFTSEPCISCGKCVDNCPMNLRPGLLSVQIENERFDLAEEEHVMDCIECGCCAYACPANRPLVHHFKRAKAEITAKRKKENS